LRAFSIEILSRLVGRASRQTPVAMFQIPTAEQDVLIFCYLVVAHIANSCQLRREFPKWEFCAEISAGHFVKSLQLALKREG
jgi:hypothetical protein